MATYTRLRNGEWGVKVQGMVHVGQNVVVKKRNGDMKNVRILKVLWTNGETSICVIEPDDGGSDGYSYVPTN